MPATPTPKPSSTNPTKTPKRLRVTGPFTVESLSPHRTISIEEKKRRSAGASPATAGWAIKTAGPSDFARIILDNLKKAPIQTGKKQERIKLDSVEAYPGEWIHGEGRFTDADNKEKRVAITIGPEFGTVEPGLVKEAAKEAVRGVGFDVLLVCGFAFDPHVSEEAKRYGNLTVLAVKMNPDLAMGDELLKKTGAGNLFMVFGEPDIQIIHRHVEPTPGQIGGELLQVQINGLDVYDPTTGDIRSDSTDDIACWFIDTDYNGESFFVRHAYFTGAGDPYEKLKRALRAEIDESAWAALYSTTSRAIRNPQVRTDRHKSNQPLRRRSPEGLQNPLRPTHQQTRNSQELTHVLHHFPEFPLTSATLSRKAYVRIGCISEDAPPPSVFIRVHQWPTTRNIFLDTPLTTLIQYSKPLASSRGTPMPTASHPSTHQNLECKSGASSPVVRQAIFSTDSTRRLVVGYVSFDSRLVVGWWPVTCRLVVDWWSVMCRFLQATFGLNPCQHSPPLPKPPAQLNCTTKTRTETSNSHPSKHVFSHPKTNQTYARWPTFR